MAGCAKNISLGRSLADVSSDFNLSFATEVNNVA